MTVFDKFDESRDHVAWISPIKGKWEASIAQEPRGGVERTSDGYVASDARGRILGKFESFADASNAVERASTRWRDPGGTLVLKATFVVAGLTAGLFAAAIFLITR